MNYIYEVVSKKVTYKENRSFFKSYVSCAPKNGKSKYLIEFADVYKS